MRRNLGSEILIATHNSGKLEEFRALLAPHGISCRSNADFGLPEPDETEETFVGNARIKALAATRATGLPALADDSGIEIDGLDGAPGVHTADWAETADGRDFVVAMTRSVDELAIRGVSRPWKATFRATLVLIWPDEHMEVFEGHMNGQMVWPMRGDVGHGYDPIFQPDEYDLTFGEMLTAQKNAISHRAIAIGKLISYLQAKRR